MGETTNSAVEGMAKKCARTGRSDTETDTDGGGEAGIFELQCRHKKGHMASIYVIDLDEQAIVDFVMDHEELYDKTNEHFKLQGLSKCKTWFESQRTRNEKLTQSNFDQAPKEMTERKI